jgi:hypothetical protein
MSVSPELSLGKVIANTSGSAYTTAGGNRFTDGQCTWYACGRACEKKGIKLAALLAAPANAGDWFTKIQYNPKIARLAASKGPIVDSIACFAHSTCGHVVYVETQRVIDGVSWTYFTEWNWNQNQNGKLQKIKTSEFANLHSGCTLLGFIVVR